MHPQEMISRIKASSIGHHIEAITPTVEIFAMMQYRVGFRNDLITRPIRLIGVEPQGRAMIGGFAEYLTQKERRDNPSFDLTESMKRRVEFMRRTAATINQPAVEILNPNEPPLLDAPPGSAPEDHGAIVGYAIASFRARNVPPDTPTKDVMVLEPGDQMLVTTVGAAELRPVFSDFVVCDYFKSEMSEYDSNYVFVSLDYLQQLRGMEGKVTCVQMRLTDYSHAKEVVQELRRMFGEGDQYIVQTWEDKQGPLLAAIAIERGILNVLLCLIVCVAGFSILAIFSMIVAEKTRDIGILKSLGASNRGVMVIFIGYGLLLGVVGSVCGTLLGLWITNHINQIEQFIAKVTGQEIFDRSVYYFDKIPTHIDPTGITIIACGAISVAVLFSMLPALRAAMLHPVRALRYE